jgi:hypothetical protein
LTRRFHTPPAAPPTLQCCLVASDRQIGVQTQKSRIVAQESSGLYRRRQCRIITLLQRFQIPGADAGLLFDLLKRQIAPLPGFSQFIPKGFGL